MRCLKVLIFLVGALSLAAAVIFGAYLGLDSWGRKEVLLDAPLIVQLEPQMPLSDLAKELEGKQLIDSGILFQLWVKLHSDYSRFQAGQYRFQKIVSPLRISSMMISGTVYVPVVLEITIPEGFTMFQVAERLSANGVGEVKDILALMKDKEFLSSLSISSSTVEGYLYPATYKFSKFPSAEQVLRKMVRTFWAKLPEDYQERTAKLGLSLNQAVIVASLIEAETAVDEEREKIAEVIWNRLKRKEALAIDASIIYGIADYRGNLSRRHLNDPKNPYNTRVHGGLPPTPICSPSRKSLVAVLTPTTEGYFFYVLDPDGEGRHHFSKTLREHNRYVRELVRAQRKRRNN